MLTIATQVTTVIALIAFVSALFVVAYRSRLKNELEIVKAADSPEKIRAIRSIRGLLIDLDAGKLSGTQTLDLAKAQLFHSSGQSTKLAVTLVVLAVILATTAAILNWKSQTREPSLSDLRQLLEDPRPYEIVDQIVANWGSPSRVIRPGTIYGDKDPTSGGLDNVVDSGGHRANDVPLLLSDRYFIEVYYVEDVADLYVVVVDGQIEAIGLGLRRIVDLPILQPVSVIDYNEIYSYADIREHHLTFEGCVYMGDFHDDNGIQLHAQLMQGEDLVNYYSCSAAAFRTDFVYHFLFRLKDDCANWMDLTWELRRRGEFVCEHISGQYNASPFGSVLYFNSLGSEQFDDRTVQAGISLAIATHAAARYSS